MTMAPSPKIKDSGYRLLASKGTGSAIIELALTLAGIAYEAEYLELEALGPGCARVTPYNPLGQVPVLIAPDGAVLSETAAIILALHDISPNAGLVPAGAAERQRFFRWLMFLVATLYPTFTYGDSPERWVSGEDAGAELRAKTDAAREGMWCFIEEQISPGPWFLGAEFSALDLYTAVMLHWRPRQDWFSGHCPKLSGVAEEVYKMPACGDALKRNFG